MSFYLHVDNPSLMMNIGDIMLEHPDVVNGTNLPDGYVKVKDVFSGQIEAHEWDDFYYERVGPELIDGVWTLTFIKTKCTPEMLAQIHERKLREELEREKRKREEVERSRQFIIDNQISIVEDKNG
jgi:hypothetical protein